MRVSRKGVYISDREAIYFAAASGVVFWAVMLGLVLGLLTSCVRPIGGDYRFTTPLVNIEYEQAVRLEVDCVYPLPPADSPAAKLIEVLGGMPTGGYGSGVAIGPGRVATARHVTDCDFDLPFELGTLAGEPMKITGTTYYGASFELAVEEEGASPDDDFAVLVALGGATPFRHWAVPRATNPHKGETVCVMAAFPYFLRRCGEAGVPDRSEGDVWMGSAYVVYDAHSDPGNSGSGVYDKDGWLVAIHVASVGRAVGGGYMVGKWRGRVPEAYAPLDMQ